MVRVTDEDRQLLAEALRGGFDVVSDDHGRFWLNGTLFGMDITARSEELIRGGLARLAEHIDPGDAAAGKTCEIHGTGEGDPLPQVVDREMLLALTKDIEEMMVKLSATVRGYEYFVEVPRTLLDSIVSIILEACGEAANGLPTARRGDVPARAEKRQDRGVASDSDERAAHEKN